MKLKALIVDDEKRAIETLKLMVGHYCKLVEIVASTTTIENGLSLYYKHKPDIVFLDIIIDSTSGFDLVSAISEENVSIILVSAHDNFGVRAVKENVTGYLLKPINPEDLIECVEKVHFKLIEASPKSEHSQLEVVYIKGKNKIERLLVNDINYITSDGPYSIIHYDGGSHYSSKNLGHFENFFSPKKFIRVHHQYIVNLNKVKEIVLQPVTIIVLKDDISIPVSRSRKKVVMTSFKAI